MDPLKATGKPHSLWVSFAKFYEENEQLDDVNAHHQNVHFNLIAVTQFCFRRFHYDDVNDHHQMVHYDLG